MPVKAKKWILAHQFHGEPKESDLELVEEELPELEDGRKLICGPYPSSDDSLS